MTGDGCTQGSDLIRLGDSRSPLRVYGSRYEAYDQKLTLANDEVDVQVMAIEINNMAALGFSGIVTQLGTACSYFRFGDKIWGYVFVDCPQTHIHVPESWCQLSPVGGSFEQAASWAIGLGSACVSVIDIAQLQAGQSIFIQNAATVVGWFAVQLAQRQDAVVLVGVNTEEERHDMEAFGVSPKHILDNYDPDLKIAISRLCSGDGCLWLCMAAAGSLVELDFMDAAKEDNDDTGEEPALSLAPFRRGATYSVFGAGHMLRMHPSKVAAMLSRVCQLQCDRGFIQPSSARIWQAPKAIDAAQWAQKNHHHGSAVLAFNPDHRIPVTLGMANPVFIDHNATYLLVGGTGGLGANLAAFLADKGARYLAVVSRSGSSAASAKSVSHRLTAAGVEVCFYAADVSNEEAMQRMMERCTVEMPPIRGVAQCAAVLEDSIYQNMTHGDWRASTRPKIHGSIILHRLLLSHDLQFFVMLSSIAGVVGNCSQAKFAAGNTVQDALAHYRGSLGLPARSDQFEEMGGTAMTGYWSGSPVPTQLMSGLPFGGILQAEGLDQPFYFEDPRFVYLHKKDLDQSRIRMDREESSGHVTLISKPATVQSIREATDLVVGALRRRLARELQTDIENIDGSQPLHSYGVDSLLAVEIRSWILMDVQADLSLFDVLGSGSIDTLGSRIAAASRAIPSRLKEDST
ncbi:polyketide synthase [Penicillium lividum]|nr:polyketide synthase [Penicillium lividum]